MPSLKRWNGSAFVDAAIPKIWNGSAFVDPSEGWYWDGTKFVKVWPLFTPTPVSITTPGSYSVPWVAGATKCDVVLCGAGHGGGTDGGPGGNTTVSTPDGVGGQGSGGGGTNTSGAMGDSPGDKTFNGRAYPGGQGGAAATTFGGTAGNGTQPGGGGGGKTIGGTTLGGAAGQWSIGATITTPQTFTGTVGTGGTPGSGSPYATLGKGGDGIAHFWFYT